tara:strand:+ start:227 stop:694 length:468 start_codon:yes stop_codon:yes gene_type:complete
MEKLVLSNITNRVATITLNSPQKYNALTAEMGKQFRSEIEKLCDPYTLDSIDAVILTGAGQAFSSGGKISWLHDRANHPPHLNKTTMQSFYNLFLSIRQLPVPTIAALNGPAIGAGLCLATACDLRVTHESNKLAFNFTKIGIHPGMGATQYLPR